MRLGPQRGRRDGLSLLSACSRCSIGLVRGPDSLEGSAADPELKQGSLFLSVCRERVREPDASERRLVRGADLAPPTDRGFESTPRAGTVTLRKAYPSRGQGGTGSKRVALK